MNLLNKIPFEPGINNRIFEHLKTAMEKLKNKLDRFCTVTLDEISISASLQFIASKGKAIGFEDLSHNEQSSKFANKALVFMIRGLRKKYKQPVVFYFTNSEMSSIKLSIIIKDIIKAVQSTGLVVMSTVCNQAPSNVASINSLIRKTIMKYLKIEKVNVVWVLKLTIKKSLIFLIYHMVSYLYADGNYTDGHISR